MSKINKLCLKLDRKINKLKKKYLITVTKIGKGLFEIGLVEYGGNFIIDARSEDGVKRAIKLIKSWIEVIILEYYYGKEKPLN